MSENRSDPRHVVGGFTLIELMIVVAILGILAVVAIPSFVRYMRIAKTAEAYRNINKIVKGIELYYTTPKYDDNGTPVPCRLPDGPMGSGNTPEKGTCCTDGEPDGKCEPNEARWDVPAWKYVLFKLSDKHYYSYSHGWEDMTWQSGGVGAFGDLDCDGIYSTFGQRIYGSRSADGLHNCRTRKTPIGSFNETE